jgi:hypothetical protein
MSKSSLPEGTFRRIRLSDGSFAYGRALDPPYVAFYEFRSSQPISELDVLENQPILFVQSVRLSGIRRWEAIGVRPLVGAVAQPFLRYSQDVLDYQQCVIFDSLGNERPATPEECVGIEQSAVWEAQGIEERLLDAFEGRANAEEVRSRVRLKP